MNAWWEEVLETLQAVFPKASVALCSEVTKKMVDFGQRCSE